MVCMEELTVSDQPDEAMLITMEALHLGRDVKALVEINSDDFRRLVPSKSADCLKRLRRCCQRKNPIQRRVLGATLGFGASIEVSGAKVTRSCTRIPSRLPEDAT